MYQREAAPNGNGPERPYLYETYDLADAYNRFFGVSAEELPEHASTVYALFQGQTFTETELIFAQSDRFKDRITTVATESPDAAVEMMYTAIFKRIPDEGARVYVDQIRNGRGSREIIDELVSSDEYRSNSLGQLYREVFGRDIDLGGRTTYGEKLKNGDSLGSIASELKASDEYQKVTGESEDRILFDGKPIYYVAVSLMDGERKQATEQVAELERRVMELEEALSQERVRREGAEGILEGREEMLRGMTDLYSQTAAQVDGMTQRLQETEARFNALLEEGRQREANQLKVIESATRENKALKEERDYLLIEKNNLVSELERARNARSTGGFGENIFLKQDNQRLNDQVINLRMHNIQLQKEIDGLRARVGDPLENARLRGENSDLRSRNPALQNRVASLEREIEILSTRRAGSQSQAEEIRRLQEEISRLRRDQQAARPAGRGEQATDIIDMMLQVCGYSRDSLTRLTPDQRAKVIPQLRRTVGKLWHQEGGGFPNNDALAKMNAFLDRYDPKFSK